jgi:hypothetical protein
VGSLTGDHPQEDLVKFGIWGSLQHFGDILREYLWPPNTWCCTKLNLWPFLHA